MAASAVLCTQGNLFDATDGRRDLPDISLPSFPSTSGQTNNQNIYRKLNRRLRRQIRNFKKEKESVPRRTIESELRDGQVENPNYPIMDFPPLPAQTDEETDYLLGPPNPVVKNLPLTDGIKWYNKEHSDFFKAYHDAAPLSSEGAVNDPADQFTDIKHLPTDGLLDTIDPFYEPEDLYETTRDLSKSSPSKSKQTSPSKSKQNSPIKKKQDITRALQSLTLEELADAIELPEEDDIPTPKISPAAPTFSLRRVPLEASKRVSSKPIAFSDRRKGHAILPEYASLSTLASRQKDASFMGQGESMIDENMFKFGKLDKPKAAPAWTKQEQNLAYENSLIEKNSRRPIGKARPQNSWTNDDTDESY